MTTNTFKEETNFEKPLKTKSISSSGSVIVSGDLEVNGNSYIKNISASTITSPSITSKQDKLVSGVNIKTINGGTLLGSGNISVVTDVSDKLSKAGDTMTGALTIETTLNVGETLNVGTENTVSGEYAFAQGSGNTASGKYSFAQGRGCTASGNYSHAEGFGSEATDLYCHAEGNHTKANGPTCHTEGVLTTASGWFGHAEGSGTTAGGFASHVEGVGTIAKNDCEHASGVYNVSTKGSSDWSFLNQDPYATLFSVGNGTSDTARDNAFEIKGNGDIYIKNRNGTMVRLQDVING